MKRNIVRALSVAAALVLMLSLAGCTLVFHVVGSEDYYEVDGTGVVEGPIEVDVTLKGLWPVWPDTLTLVIAGTVNPVSVSDAGDMADVALANSIEHEIYLKLFNNGDNDFDEIEEEEGLAGLDDKFKVTAIMPIPDWKDSIPTGSANAAVTIPGISLQQLLPEQYPELVDALIEACGYIPVGDEVEVQLSGTLVNEAKNNKLVGDLLIGVRLIGTGTLIP